ncbi:UDP-N-acetylmuramate:L-alanyl-gamma-D-glutamyl-meso-diaminopimelate ligase [Bradymonadaceae bacterium TMQ3]|nr:UDP-N-acetylmuramate:L-alanyl-gamma-D-glutamyl-meso-diaminopimelate ligase [Bradymonadaceae bacterium TMQ3]TXC77601.1 UDP-N-acetylmuramate:L-alanyl-gamma-D-glutamyl-meso-diaminopimelate ligase [Bradymonadales bacterium TMQ1]
MTAEKPRDFPALPDAIERIHIIGICGTAMGSLAAMLKERGFEVRGSDAMAYPPMSTWLEERGIDIMRGYDKANLDWNPDIVIVGNVSRASYADAVATRERNIPYLSLPEALRHFFFEARRPLVLTGTHGKTTTTGMLAWILTDQGRDPGFMVGGITGNFGSNYRLGHGDTFVIEGDEYDTAYFDKVPKFWHYAPFRATINNLEFDHADIYESVEDIEHVFRRFCDLIPAEGSLWVNGDDPRAMAVSAHRQDIRKTFGLGEGNTLRATDLRFEKGRTRTTITLGGQALGELDLATLGDFNVRNALGATALAMDEGLSFAQIADAMHRFKSVRRRQEHIAHVDGIDIYDDFAHHPTAVGATLSAMRSQFPDRRIWAIFEAKSNTSRRRVFQDDYPPAFAQADRVILSRPWKKDDDLPEEMRVDISDIAESIRQLGPTTELIEEVDDIVRHVAGQAEPGDLIVGLSGAAFGGLHHKLASALRERFES